MKRKFSHQHLLLQRMSLTPQMRQSIQLLGMSAGDISEYIDTLVTKNPFLQKLIDEKTSAKYKNKHSPAATDDISDYSDNVRHEENPRLGLLSNMGMLGLDDETLKIAEYLIFEMDDNGYINIDSEDAAADLSVEAEDVEKCLEIIQGMEPAGIGARDIRECLQLQLKRADKEDSLEYKIVSELLAEVARNDIEGIADLLGADRAKVRSAVDYIKKLNPRPASTLLTKQTEKVIPELVAKVDKDKVRLELNSSSLPRLKIYNPYEDKFDVIKDPEARKFLKENLDIAKGLMDNLKRREDTICKVASFILNFQKEAIAKGGVGVETLTLKDVAGALNFHPSTISRAVSNKYIQINDKVVPMASLLSHGITRENGEITSKSAVKNVILKLINNEDKSSPFSDTQIEAKLKEEGLPIKRRTVANYRKVLRILPANLRKKIKAA